MHSKGMCYIVCTCNKQYNIITHMYMYVHMQVHCFYSHGMMLANLFLFLLLFAASVGATGSVLRH